MEKTATVDTSDEYQRVEAYHQHVAEDIDNHCIDAIFPDQNAAIYLRRRHNEALLLCRCPPEILELIFSIVASRPRLPLFSHSTRIPHLIPMVARISHVCNYWRNVCLNDPRLWTNIDVDLVGKWPMVFVQRSGSAALKIIADIDHCASDFLDAIILAIPRVQSLHILGFQGRLTRFVQQLTAPAPILEAVTFNRSFQWYSEEGGLPTSPRHALFPTTLFSGYAPRLRDLSMSGCCPANVPMAAFSSITSLRASESFSIYDTMYFLSQAAGLVALDVGPNAFDYHLPSVGHARIIHLPNMNKLRVRLLPTMAAATAFLSALHVPHLSQLDVSISAEHVDHDLAQHVLHILSTLLAILMKHTQEWHRLSIVFELSHVSIEFGEPLEHSGFDSDHDSKPPLPPFVVSWREGSGSDSDLERMLLWTLNILPVDEVMFLSIVQGYEPSGRRWHHWSTLDAYKRVTTLRIETQYPKTVIDILRAATPASTLGDESNSPGASASDGSTPACIFPQLKKVILIEVPLKARGSKLLPALRQFVLSRKSERSLIEIAFEDCNYSADVMLAVYDVAKVTWDGKWCPPFSFGAGGEGPILENWEGWGRLFD